MASSRHDRLSVFVIAMGFAIATTTGVQFTEARTVTYGTCESFVNQDFEITCLKTDILQLNVVCKSSSPDAWGNLPSHRLGPTSISWMSFRNCSFPAGLSLLNVTETLGVASNYTLVIEQARTLLRREHLGGLHLEKFYLTNSNFDLDGESDGQLPGDLLHDLQANFINFQNLTFTSVPTDFFVRASKLRQLWMRYLGGLRRLGRHDFAALKNLQVLILNYNSIEEIENGSFDQLHNLKDLQIIGNRLHTLPPDIFRRLVRLETLNLSNNEFDELPGDLLRVDGNKLQRVQLNYNRGIMRSLPSGFFRNLSSLNHVELIRNDFTNITGDVFHGASFLETLDISENNLTSLPAELFEDTSLVEFRASKNRLTSLPEGLFDGIYLEKLYLSDNLFSNITQYGFSSLNHLNILDFSHNNLSYIEPQICDDLKHVETIDLSYNQLNLIGREMPDTDSLSVLLNCFYSKKSNLFLASLYNIIKDQSQNMMVRNLNLEGNRITHLTIKHLELLRPGMTLNLNNNEISTVALENLKTVAKDYRNKNKISKNIRVSLNNNPLNCDCQLLDFFRYFERKLDPEVYNFIKIETKELKCANPRHLRGKLINTIPSEELRCQMAGNETTSDDACSRNCTCWRIPGKRVLSVDCSYHNLTSVPPMVRNPYDWSIELNMSGNHLRSTPRMNVSYLANVTTLDLSFNNISDVTRDLFGSKALRVLKLHNNNISRLDYYVVQHLYDDDLLTNLTLHGNPYICDCGTRDMLNFVQRKLDVFELHTITCRENNRRLFEMTNNELCDGMNKFILIGAIFCAFLGFIVAFYFKYKMTFKVWLL